jgi:phage recombination protein Bet
MSTDVAVIQDMSNDKLELIKKTVAKGATDLELELFLHACKRTGLDPLMKQIYAIKRRNNKTGVDDMSIQTGIDGYRLIADRTGFYAGSDEPTYMIADDGWPDVASVTVHKLVGGVRCPFSASARWKEYCQDSSPMWKKMPFLMLGKCAEALALRKAFPAELSGVYTQEEMMQADNEPVSTPKAQAYTASKQVAQAKMQELRVEGPARQDGGQNGGPTDGQGTGSPLSTQQGPDAAAPFTWRMGKHKGKPITEIPLDYLTWACTNMTAEDHRMAALAEIDRLQAQDVMRFEAEQVETQ